MDKYGYIYKVENDVNNKIYIGQTMQIPERRFKDHLRNKRSNDKFHKAIREIGPSHFKLEILENVNRDSLDEREKYWIEYFKAYKDGYNSTPGGRGYPVGWYAPIEVIEARLIFESREELCRILSNYFHINLPYLRIESNMEKHFNFHLRYTNSRIFSSMKRINKWLETLTCNNLLKGIKCIDTGMEFESITDAANYYINNELYTGRSQGNVKQSVVTSISQNLLGKTEFVSVLNNYKFEYTNIIIFAFFMNIFVKNCTFV